jgi:antitoxin component of MazEF toxin-antitoxin module
MNKRRIYRQGNSLVVSLPPAILSDIDLLEGDYVNVSMNHIRGLVITPIRCTNGKWVTGNPRDKSALPPESETSR